LFYSQSSKTVSIDINQSNTIDEGQDVAVSHQLPSTSRGSLTRYPPHPPHNIYEDSDDDEETGDVGGAGDVDTTGDVGGAGDVDATGDVGGAGDVDATGDVGGAGERAGERKITAVFCTFCPEGKCIV
jgi:hypothetical protein